MDEMCRICFISLNMAGALTWLVVGDMYIVPL